MTAIKEIKNAWQIRGRVRAYKLELVAQAMVDKSPEEVDFINKYLDSIKGVEQRDNIILAVRRDLEALLILKDNLLAAKALEKKAK